MTTTEIILAIISSSVLASTLTSLFNWFIHRSNYKNEYYKKILDRRLDAYEKFNKIVGKLSMHTQLDNTVIPTICFSRILFSDFVVSLALTIDLSYWLSSETSTKLTELSVYLLNNISNNIKDNLSPDEAEIVYHQLGNEHIEKLRSFRKELQSLMSKDLRDLYKVKKFFKPDKSNTTFAVFKKEK